ncbi:discoidin domain-containing protein [Streptomyces sp. AK02-01A]|uniref:discoidin domain-containing protein n=1 Tax=Streptomyces sp. AK02-01A TaxID=3028648 RepID=UPI0029AB48A5|nr:discoidin domain-containing protein [Streptomyces sp. AK02-01A]MDX3852423.1 discoidin domain-containing protein [Streptomyces sp. AK02-01A]
MGQQRTTRESSRDFGRGRGQGRRRARGYAALLALAVAVPLVVPGTALAGTSSARALAAGPPTAAQQWDTLKAKLSGIKGVWTDQSYSGSLSNTMPDTALLGNGDVGVTSGGSTGVKTFYVSKGDFWNANPSPKPAPIGGVTITGTTAQPSGNLALGARATASSTEGSFTADRAVNGQWSSGYEGWVSAVGKPQWISLDLGSVKTVGRYVVRNDNAARPGNAAFNTKTLAFQTSGDGVTWNSVDTVQNNTADVIDRAITPVQARYIRFNITEPTQGTTSDSVQNPRARVGQIELYQQSGGTTPPPAPPFREEENIVDGTIGTSVTLGNAPVSMKTWLAADKNVLVTSITSTGSAPVQLQASTFAGATTPNSAYSNTAGTDGQVMWAERATATGSKWVSRGALATTVLGGTAVQQPTVSGATAKTLFTVPAGQTVTVVTTVGGGGQNPAAPHNDAVTQVRAQSAASLATLDTQRVNWWKNYWMQSGVELGDATLEKFYYGAQYFIGAASRQGKLAPALYGLWTTTDNPQFSGDFHLNYNAQAPFYGVYSSNRPELSLPFHETILAYVPEAQRRAKQDLNRVKPDYISRRFPSGGVPAGVLFPVGIGPYGSTTDDQYHQQVSNSLFTASQFIEYYDYTQDVDFLRTKAYPFLNQVALFFESYLERDASTGRYSLWSGPHEGTWGQNSSADLGLLKQVLSSLIAGSQKLGVDADRRTTWQNILNNLPAQPTTVYNGKTVFSLATAGTMQGSDTRDIHPGDNTINLEFVQPADQLGINSDPALLRTAVDTLDAMNSWGQENSFPKVFNQAARVGYPAQSLIDKFTSVINARIAPNLRISDPHHGIEKSGATEAINSMLIQTDQQYITLFPDWPAGKDAGFYQLRQKGAFVVSSAKRSDKVSYVDVISKAGGALKLKNPWTTSFTVTDANGGAVPFTTANGVISVQTAVGQTYHLLPAA